MWNRRHFKYRDKKTNGGILIKYILRHSVMGNEVFNKAYPSGTVSHREGRKSK